MEVDDPGFEGQGLESKSSDLLVATGAPFLLGLSYVGSLYVWRSTKDRDHDDTIKRRFISAAFMTLISPVFVHMLGAASLLDKYSLAEVIGLRTAGLGQALVLPLLLTFVLFLGPSVMLFLEVTGIETCSSASICWHRLRLNLTFYWRRSIRDWKWWRNHVVAPFSEEFTFRACMLPMLLRHYTPTQAIIVSPLFFGVAHFHHMVERIKKGEPVLASFLISMFQFTYTTIFGMYSALLFIRTGHFAAPFLVHAYCNFMGFPDFAEVANAEPRRRTFLSAMFLLGAISFYLAIDLLTEPSLYQNLVYDGGL